jgi:hypothetical protein
MAKPKKDFVLDPEVEASIDQIADGLRTYLRLLLKKTAVSSPPNGRRG